MVEMAGHEDDNAMIMTMTNRVRLHMMSATERGEGYSADFYFSDKEEGGWPISDFF